MKAESDFELPTSPSLEKRFTGTQHLLPSIDRSDSRASERTLINMSETEMEEKGRNGDAEKGTLEPQTTTITTKDHKTQDPLARAKMFMWMFINTLATVFIVSAVFLLRHCVPGCRSTDTPGQHGQFWLKVLFFSIHHLLTCPLSFRSSAIKLSSPIHPFPSVRPPSPPSTFSSRQRHSTYSLDQPLICSLPSSYPFTT